MPVVSGQLSTVCEAVDLCASAPCCLTSLLAHMAVFGRTDRARARWRRVGQLSFQRLAERYEISIQGDAEIAEFNHIESAYPALDVAHEVLHDAKLRREVFLPHPAPMAELAQQVAQALVFDAMDGFAHGRCQWERSWTLYCRIVFTNLVYLARAMLGLLASSYDGYARKGRVGFHIGTKALG